MPKEVRRRLNLRPGKRYQVISYGDCIEFVPVRKPQEMRGVLKGMRLIVPAICIYEVFKKILSLTNEKKSLEIVATMRMGEVVPFDDQRALSAANLSHLYKLPMAESIILAVSQEYKAVLWTQDV